MSRGIRILALLALRVYGAPLRSVTEPTTTTTLSETADDASTAAASHETLSTVSKTQGPTTATSTTTEPPEPTIARVRPEWVEDYEARFGRGALRDRWKTMTLPPWAPLLTDPRYHNTKINSDFYDGPMTDYTPWEQTHESDYHPDMFDPWGLLGVGIRSTTTSTTSANATSTTAPETTALTSKGDKPEELSVRDVAGGPTDVGSGNTNVTVDGDVRDLVNSRANIGSNTNETVDGETRDRLNSFVIVSGKTDAAIDTEIQDLVNSRTNVGPNGETNFTVDRETRDRLNTVVIVSGTTDPAMDSKIRDLVNGRTIVGQNGEANITLDGEVRDIVNGRINVSTNGTTNATVGEAVRDLLNFFVIVPSTEGGFAVDAQPHEEDADFQHEENGTPIQKPGQMTPEQIKSAFGSWGAQGHIWAHQEADQQVGEVEAGDVENTGIFDESSPSLNIQGVTVVHTTLETRAAVRGESTSNGAMQTTA